MKLELLAQPFSVCKVADYSDAPLEDTFCFLGKTDKERSLVCRTSRIPANTTAREDGWRAFRVAGTLDFSLVGILAKIADVLAAAGVSIFAVSTYDTDYVLTHDAAAACAALRSAGYAIEEVQ